MIGWRANNLKPKKALDADKILADRGINVAEYKEQQKVAKKRLRELNSRIQAARVARSEDHHRNKRTKITIIIEAQGEVEYCVRTG